MEEIIINNEKIFPGEKKIIDIPIARLYSHAQITMPVKVLRGKNNGPVLFVCAAIHGDEINGVEIIRRLLKQRILNRLKGTLIAVPIVNVLGFASNSRYLPDRRDLNRSFPGSDSGSLAARLAYLFMNEIALKCNFGIDLHTGAIYRSNLPHIRACTDDPETKRIAQAFGTPVILNSKVRDGSLRQSVMENNIPMLLYEGGEALRFDEWAIKAGLKGIISVMQSIGMLPESTKPKRQIKHAIADSSAWVRASISGIVEPVLKLGSTVSENDVIAKVSSPFGDEMQKIRTRISGVIIGQRNLPLVYKGDAIYNIASFDTPDYVQERIKDFNTELDVDFGDDTMK